jgi:hypothetical protein
MTSPAFGDFQLEIYLAGLQGVLPSFPMAFAELEARAAQALPPSVLSYVAGGAGSEHTQRANAGAFRQWGLVAARGVGERRLGEGVDDGLVLPVSLRKVRRDPPLPDVMPEVIGVQVHAGRQAVGQQTGHGALPGAGRPGQDDHGAGAMARSRAGGRLRHCFRPGQCRLRLPMLRDPSWGTCPSSSASRT